MLVIISASIVQFRLPCRAPIRVSTEGSTRVLCAFSIVIIKAAICYPKWGVLAQCLIWQDASKWSEVVE